MILLSYLLSCGDLSETACQNAIDCSLDSVCRDGICTAVSCFRNSDCGWSEYCDFGACISGCQLDSDCMAGEHCESGECVESGCENTRIDCAFGQYCIQGECIDSDPPVCERCDYADWEQGMADERECVTYRFGSDQTCSWPDGLGCDPAFSCFPGHDEAGEGFCVELFAFSYCESNDDCPRGFSCWRDIYGEGSGVSVCEADCNGYEDLLGVGE